MFRASCEVGSLRVGIMRRDLFLPLERQSSSCGGPIPAHLVAGDRQFGAGGAVYQSKAEFIAGNTSLESSAKVRGAWDGQLSANCGSRLLKAKHIGPSLTDGAPQTTRSPGSHPRPGYIHGWGGALGALCEEAHPADTKIRSPIAHGNGRMLCPPSRVQLVVARK